MEVAILHRFYCILISLQTDSMVKSSVFHIFIICNHIMLQETIQSFHVVAVYRNNGEHKE